MVLCDVSGSVSEFVQFMFTLVHALHAELSRVRSFAFIDGIVEVTDLFATATHDLHVALGLLERRADRRRRPLRLRPGIAIRSNEG